jgi:hypothetical protein
VALLALTFEYPWVALPIFGVIVIAILAFLPFLYRVARFLMAGLYGRILSWFSLPPESPPPGSVRVYARGVKGVSRLTPGWLRLETGSFTFTHWGRARKLQLGAVQPEVEWGFVFNITRTANGSTLYLTKEWCQLYVYSLELHKRGC